ncbi:Protein argonaute 4 [Abeliophyllum distichum]|uniref:Protein argonaute 4 n=1 Tax=Abeliophyllum distichum TaxID=126358 RepID=A0ABD1TGN6_9LAMI
MEASKDDASPPAKRVSMERRDISTALLVKPGPVMDFLLENQKVEHPNLIKWDKALNSSNYNDDPILLSSRISIDGDFTIVQGRVLAPPKVVAYGLFSKWLRVGNGKRVDLSVLILLNYCS